MTAQNMDARRLERLAYGLIGWYNLLFGTANTFDTIDADLAIFRELTAMKDTPTNRDALRTTVRSASRCLAEDFRPWIEGDHPYRQDGFFAASIRKDMELLLGDYDSMVRILAKAEAA